MPPAAAVVIKQRGNEGPDATVDTIKFMLSCYSNKPAPFFSHLAAIVYLLVRGLTPEGIRGPKDGPVRFLNGKPVVWRERGQK